MGGANWWATLSKLCAGEYALNDDVHAMGKRIEASLLKQQQEAQRALSTAVVSTVTTTMQRMDDTVRNAVGEIEQKVADSSIAHGAALSLQLEQSATRSMQQAVDRLATCHREERAAQDSVLNTLSTALKSAADTGGTKTSRVHRRRD